MTEKKLMAEFFRELSRAWDRFALRLAYSLRLDVICRFLARLIDELDSFFGEED